ncbi:putative manganese transporter [Clostridium cylindrosporum]|uniref:Permease n=1 Tax=Clostridium cylindrosporum DSM 605 TaxID=1121307 RepID=A0A0J8DEA6_CLOCY|nr:putative manganese transporter [Clostridium cylindrosporum]KMT22523.1 hypothetical protein CLCY_10c00680 [Clostridium cylindrosporum DSM 605]
MELLHEGHLHGDETGFFAVLEHSLIDIIPMIIILILTFVAIEYIEHKFSARLQDKVRNAGILGPLLGAIVGIIPQCGFSVMAVALYSRKIISLGTMMAIFLATSDETIPVLLSTPGAYKHILPIIGAKLVIAIVAGYIIDIIFGRKSMKVDIKSTKEMESEGEKCLDHEKISLSKVFIHSIQRSFKVGIYIYVITVLITLLIEYFHIDKFDSIIFTEGYIQIFLVSLIGLIPNCAVSLGIVKLFTMNVIGFSSVIAGLSSNAGLALIFLFKESKNKKKALLITLMLFVISLLSGITLHIFY